MQQESFKDRLLQFEEICRAKGVPVTIQRRLILEAVLQREDHPSADQIHEEIIDRLPNVSRTTIYRVLDALVELGVVRKIGQTGTTRYDGKIDRHHHLVCNSCGMIIDLEDSTLNDLDVPKKKLQGFQVDDFSIYFSGVCSDCQKRRE